MQNDVIKATMLTTKESSDGTCGGNTYAPMKIKKQKESSKSITIPFLLFPLSAWHGLFCKTKRRVHHGGRLGLGRHHSLRPHRAL